MRLLTKEQRLASRWAPEGATKYTHEATGVEVHTFTNRNDKPSVIVYVGSAAKPSAHYHFSHAWARLACVLRIVDGQRMHKDFRTEQRQRRAQPHSLQVGHILCSSWGYDQTNVDFYQVVKVVSPHTVEIRPIGGHSLENESTGNSMADYVIPTPDAFCGAVSRHRCGPDNSLRISSCQHARLWGGKPQYRSWYA